MKACEKIYPYVIAGLLSLILLVEDVNFLDSDNINNALDSIITVTSIIIGFIGAILPVLLSMKNESKFVKYVFERDVDKLFLKYIKQTLITGICLIIISIIIYFKDQYIQCGIYKYCFCIVVFFLISFLLCTYRCLKNMLDLIFQNDNMLFEECDFKQRTEEELELVKQLKEEEVKGNEK